MNAQLSIADPKKHILTLSKQLDHAFADRAALDVKHAKGVTTFYVTAQDATALRSMLNAICKMLQVYQTP
jgi:tRNA threonylcarbamoyladenosine modification (KEOPS) complex  Pcc1 subunit